MDIGEDGHILLSSRTAEDLRELSDVYKRTIKPLHDYTIKHGQTFLIYSAYGKNFGNSKVPIRSSHQRSKMNREISRLKKTTIYPQIEVDISIKDPKRKRVHYKRIYELQNISEKPIHKVVHGIATDIEKTFDELNVRVYDEDNKRLKISTISIDKPYQKEFTTIFNRPIMKGEKSRSYTLEYDIEEPEKYFENSFLVNCQKFIVNIDYPTSMSFPRVYEMDLENDEKELCKLQPLALERKEPNRNLVRWIKRDISQG